MGIPGKARHIAGLRADVLRDVGLERFIADVVAGAIRPVATFLRCDGHGCGVRVDAPPATTADAMRRAWAVLGWQYTADGYDLCPACADKLPVA